MTDDSQRIADLVELHALCARYMAYTSQFVEDRWLDVFTPDVEYNAFGTAVHARALPGAAGGRAARPVHRQHAGRRARRRPRHGDAALRLLRPADARHAPGLVPRRVRAHRRRLAHPSTRHHVHAQARRLRLRASARSARGAELEGASMNAAARTSSASTTTSSSRPRSGRSGSRQRCASKGPRIERARGASSRSTSGASYKQEMTEDGRWGDYWVYEDRIIYVHKRHVAIPLDATPDGDVSRFDRSKMYIAAMTYDEMRPGCYDPKARVEDLALGRRRRLARLPDVPALLRPDVHGGCRSRARAGVRACLQRLDDRRVVRRLRRPT